MLLRHHAVPPLLSLWLAFGLAQAAESRSKSAALGRSESSPRLSTVAGTGNAGTRGDGGPAKLAELGDPFGLVRGPDGALWFCDYATHSIRRIAPAGIITTIIGTGQPGYSGDGASARHATLNHPHELRFDRAGSLFIADTGNHVIRKYDPKIDVITTFAGTGTAGNSGDGGRAAQAEFREPISLQFGPVGELLVADVASHVIRRIDPNTGMITTWAGTGRPGETPDGAPIRGTPLNGPRSLDFDASGDVWLVTREGNQVLRFRTGQGVIRLVAGTGKKGFDGNGGPAASATFNGPKGIAVAGDGRVYLADTENHAIRRLDPRSGVIELVVGTGQPGDGPDGDPLRASLRRPHGVFVDLDGAVLIGDSENHRIRRWNP